MSDEFVERQKVFAHSVWEFAAEQDMDSFELLSALVNTLVWASVSLKAEEVTLDMARDNVVQNIDLSFNEYREQRVVN